MSSEGKFGAWLNETWKIEIRIMSDLVVQVLKWEAMT